MEVLHTTNKGKLLDTMERFYIYKETNINDKNTTKPKMIIETTVREDTGRAHTTC
jgi:hypothetical protein